MYVSPLQSCSVTRAAPRDSVQKPPSFSSWKSLLRGRASVGAMPMFSRNVVHFCTSPGIPSSSASACDSRTSSIARRRLSSSVQRASEVP